MTIYKCSKNKKEYVVKYKEKKRKYKKKEKRKKVLRRRKDGKTNVVYLRGVELWKGCDMITGM